MKNLNQDSVDPHPVFNHDRERDETFSTRICLKILNQAPVEMILPVEVVSQTPRDTLYRHISLQYAHLEKIGHPLMKPTGQI